MVPSSGPRAADGCLTSSLPSSAAVAVPQRQPMLAAACPSSGHQQISTSGRPGAGALVVGSPPRSLYRAFRPILPASSVHCLRENLQCGTYDKIGVEDDFDHPAKRGSLQELNVLQRLHNKQEELKNRRIKNLEAEVLKLRRTNSTLENSIGSIFNADQIEKLATGHVKKWSVDTLKRAIQLRTKCGVKAYIDLTHYIPLPPYSTMCRRIQNIPLCIGINHHTVNVMGEKKKAGDNWDDNVCLQIDEMETSEALEYAVDIDQTIGNCTLGDKSVKANKLLLLIARGVTFKWKQIVGCHLTTDKKNCSPKGKELLDFVMDGVKRLEGAGYKVLSITSDMGSLNQAMWNAAGIKCDRENVNISICNPCNPGRKFYFIPDPPHLLKNLRNGLLNYDILLPADTVKKHNLKSNVVSASWLRKFLEIKNKKKKKKRGDSSGSESEEEEVNCSSNEEDVNDELDVVFNLGYHLDDKVLNPQMFDVMKVNLAKKLFSLETAVCIEAAVKVHLLPEEALTTAFFIRQVHTWFEMITSRHRKCSITRRNKMHKFKFLKEFTMMISTMTNTTGAWKPYQKGILQCTYSIMEITNELLKKLKYVLTSRFTQDACENTFSTVRAKGNKNPSPLQALRIVRLISVAQITKKVTASNYEHDDEIHYLDFLSRPYKPPPMYDFDKEEIEILLTDQDKEMCQDFTKLRRLEEPTLVHFAGYVLYKIKNKICNECLDYSIDEEKKGDKNLFLVSKLKDFGGLHFVTPPLAYAIRILELTAKRVQRVFVEENDKIVQKLTCHALPAVEGVYLPECDCKFAWKFTHFFYKCRLFFYLRKFNKLSDKKDKKIYSSKSAREQSEKRNNSKQTERSSNVTGKENYNSTNKICKKNKISFPSVTEKTNFGAKLDSNVKSGSINICMVDLKSLDPFITQEEEEIIRVNAWASFVSGMVTDSIIDGFLDILCSMHSNVGASFANASFAELVISGMDNTMELSFLNEEHQLIFFPMNVCTGMHWAMFVLSRKEMTLSYLDSNTEDVRTTTYFEDVMRYFTYINDKLKLNIPDFISPKTVKQENGTSCGVFLMYFAKCILEGGTSLNTSFNETEFREYIFSLLFEKAAVKNTISKVSKKKFKKPTRQQQQQQQATRKERSRKKQKSVYCICNKEAGEGSMIMCENPACVIQWFHFTCVAIKVAPRGQWFCPWCRRDKPQSHAPRE